MATAVRLMRYMRPGSTGAPVIDDGVIWVVEVKSGPASSRGDRLKIGFILSRSFTLSAFAMFIDTLRLASDVQVAPTSDFVNSATFNYIVVVGGLLNHEAPIDADTVAYLRKAASKKVPLIGVCTGTFILAEAGLMDNHQVCVSWLHHDAFRDRFPHLEVRADRIFNLDRNRGSCAGGSSAADLAAFIVRRHISKEAERNALEVLQIDRARTAKDIQPRRPLLIESDDPRLQAALIIMERNIENTLSVGELATAVGVSRRQLERVFLEKAKSSPALVYRRLRLERARHLLLQTKAPLIEIALEVGFENASHFARLFRKAYGVSPTALRTSTAKSVAAQA